MDAEGYSESGGEGRLVTHLDLLTRDIDLDALRKALRVEREASDEALRAKSASTTVVSFRTQKRRAA